MPWIHESIPIRLARSRAMNGKQNKRNVDFAPFSVFDTPQQQYHNRNAGKWSVPSIHVNSIEERK
jgi:hypothetical protein